MSVPSLLGMRRRQDVKALLSEGEELIQRMSGSFEDGMSLGKSWKICNIALTNHRIISYQVNKFLFMIPISCITKMEVVKRRWILGKKVKQLYLELIAHRRNNIYLAVAQPEKWMASIKFLNEAKEQLSDVQNYRYRSGDNK